MAVDPPTTPPPAPPSRGKADSGEHVTVSTGGGSFRIPKSWITKIVGALLMMAVPTIWGKIDHSDAEKKAAEAAKKAEKVAEDVKETAKPVIDHAAKLTEATSDSAKLAAILADLQTRVAKLETRRRRPDAGAAEKAANVAVTLKAIEARTAKKPLTVPGTVLADPPVQQPKPQIQPIQQGSAGGGNP